MPKTYVKLSPEEVVYENLREAMQTYHPDLAAAELTFDVLLASGPRDKNGEVCGPAVTVGGYQRMGKIKIVGPEDRANLVNDVKITLDGDRLNEISHEYFMALVNDLWCRVALVVDKDGAVVRDDLGRPKLRAVKPDIQIDGFMSVAEKHHENAAVVKSINDANRAMIEHGCFSFSGG